MSPAEHIGDGLLLPTKGLITVDLIDADTGRVIQREESENFLSAQSLKVAKWWQRMMWGAYNPVETGDAAGNKPTEMPWFPAQHLAYWNDAAAEVAGTEDRVGADLVGWASRHPIGSASGKRGVVNISESEFKDASAKWVFDWATSQGNGTFQSVGWTRVDEGSGFPVARFPEDDAVTFTNLGNQTGGSTNTNPLWWDSAGSVWNLTEWVSATGQYRVVSAPATGGATTQICLLPTTWGGQFLFGLARIGTDIVVCGQPVSNPKLARYTSSGTQVWTRTESPLTIIYNDCTVDGSGNIWTAGSDGIMRRHSNADGTIAATITPAAGPTVLTGISYDATDGGFWVTGTVGGVTFQLWKVDASGNSLAPLYSLRTTAATVTSTAPYAGSYNLPAASARDPYALTQFTSNALVGSNINRAPSRLASTWLTVALATLATKSGEPWIANRSNTGSEIGGAGRASAVRGGTLGTRSKLASAITKTSAQTLKVTYQFNFS